VLPDLLRHARRLSERDAGPMQAKALNAEDAEGAEEKRERD
jgi:hypothetical protein